VNPIEKGIIVPVPNNFVSALEVLLPPLNSGLLLGGFVLFTYLAIAYKSGLYAAIALLGFTAFVFVASDTVNAVWGVWLGNMAIGAQFHRLTQTVGAYFLFALPFLLVYLLKLGDRWKQVNFRIALVGLGLAVVFTVVAYAFPDLYISMKQKVYSEIPGRVTFLWGREGIVYQIRDGLIGLVVVYSLVCILADMIRNKRRDLLPFFFGVLAAIGGAAIDMIAVWRGMKYFLLFPNDNFTRFAVGLTLLVLALMSGVVREFIRLSKEVHKAHERIKLSERKNRILAQGTKDCILSLNDDYSFLNANKQAFKQLHLSKESLEKTNFLDLVSSDSGSAPFLLNVIKERLAALKRTKESVAMKLRLRCSLPTESRSYNVSFDCVDTEEGNEIIVTASQPHEETYLKYVQAESGKYVIDNYLLTVEEVSNKLVSSLAKFTHADGVKQVQFGLREMLINALEHGNLNIKSEEKNRALMEDRYFQFLSSRQNMPEHKDKKITVEYSVSPAKAVYRITDQGKGFDCHSLLKEVQGAGENLNLQGRGILMALRSFDKISYNERGNSVTLVKNFG
jgi:PAS domain-containing protein